MQARNPAMKPLPGGIGFSRTDVDETNNNPCTQLRQSRQIGAYDVSQSRIATDGLGIGEQYDGATIRRQLNGARCNRC